MVLETDNPANGNPIYGNWRIGGLPAAFAGLHGNAPFGLEQFSVKFLLLEELKNQLKFYIARLNPNPDPSKVDRVTLWICTEIRSNASLPLSVVRRL